MSEQGPTTPPQPNAERVSMNDRLLNAMNKHVENTEVAALQESYDAMDVDELALELAEAIDRDDTIGAEQIRATADYKIMDQITRPDHQTDVADDEYSDEVTKFSDMVGQLSKRLSSPGDWVAPSAAGAGDVLGAPEGVPSELAIGSHVTFEGKKGFIQEVFTSSTGDQMFEIMDEEGDMHFTRSENVVDIDAAAVAAEATPTEAVDVVANPVEAGATSPEDAATTDPENLPTPEAKEKWFAKHKEKLKNIFRPSYWGARFSGVQYRFMEKGVTENMTDEERNKQRNKNRGIMMLGIAGSAVGLYAAGLLTHQLFDALGAHPGAVGAGGGGGGGGGGEAAAITDPNAHSGSGSAETTFNPPEVIDPNFTISNNEGGYRLLGSLGIDPSKWDGIEQQLKTLSPSEFFLMDDGHYGLQNPGAILSEPVRNLINTLK